MTAEEGARRDATHNLQLDALPVELDCANLEVNADGRDEGGGPCVVAETEKQTRLADTCNTAQASHHEQQSEDDNT